ncbi:MAG: hypothetical protein ACUVYA_20685 [Planctomycetota bacterium]
MEGRVLFFRVCGGEVRAAFRSPRALGKAAGTVAVLGALGLIGGCSFFSAGGRVDSAGAPAGPEAPGETGKPAAPVAGTEPKLEPKPEVPPEPVPAPPGLSDACRGKLEEIRRLASGIPLVFSELKRSSDEINADMVRVTELSRAFLAECSGTAADCEVKAALARMLIGRQRRYQDELEQAKLPKEDVRAKVKALMAEVEDLARSVSASCEAGSDPWCYARRMLLEALVSSGRYEEARAAGATVREKCASAEIRSGVVSAVVQTLMAERKHDEAVDYLERLIAEHGDDPSYYVYVIRLFEALYGAGRLEDIEELMHLIRAEYPHRIEEAGPGLAKVQYEQWYHCQSVFWLGFVRMALGDMGEAERYFSENVNEIETLTAKLSAEGKKIDSVCPIIADFRSKSLLGFIREYYGRPPAYDLDELLWATSETFRFRDAVGDVVVIVTRRPGDTRAETFLQEVDRLVRARKAEGLRGLTLGFLVGRSANPRDDEANLEKMREDLKALGVSLPGGFDPDRQDQKIVRGIFGTVGTASCTVIDRRGELAWSLADARDLDRKILLRVVDRLLREK